MSDPSLHAEEMLAWNEKTAQSWRQLVEEKPEILNLECDIFGVKSIRQLLQHIVAVEMRYAQRLAGLVETPYEAIPCDSAAGIFDAHAAAMAGLRAEVARAGDWDRTLDFQTLTMGRVRASRKTLFFHALLHSIRHYAQLATLVRGHGFKTRLPMDYMLMGAQSTD